MRCCFLLFLAVLFLLSAKSANTVSQPTFLVKFDVLQKHFKWYVALKVSDLHNYVFVINILLCNHALPG